MANRLLILILIYYLIKIKLNAKPIDNKNQTKKIKINSLNDGVFGVDDVFGLIGLIGVVGVVSLVDV